MSNVNNVYNLFWDFVDLKIWERFGDDVFEKEEGMSLVNELLVRYDFAEWIHSGWDSREYGEVLSMEATLEVLKYVNDYIGVMGMTVDDDLTPNELINRYGVAITQMDAGKLSLHIDNLIAKRSGPATPPPRKRKRYDVEAVCEPRKRKREDDVEAVCEPRKRKREDEVRCDVEEKSDEDMTWPWQSDFFLCLALKMTEEPKFDEWVKSGDCLRRLSTRPSDSKRKLKRDTCEPIELKLERKCIARGVTFDDLVGRFNYTMSRRNLDSVRTVLETHYPECDVEELAHHCVSHNVHPDDYDFRFPDEKDAWNKRIGLIPNTPHKYRRSERLKTDN